VSCADPNKAVHLLDCQGLPTSTHKLSTVSGNLRIQLLMRETAPSIFQERYRVIAVDSDQLVIRGTLSGEVLTIINPDPATPLSREDYPPGTLIALSEPPTSTPN
jgi:hypothetical protein